MGQWLFIGAESFHTAIATETAESPAASGPYIRKKVIAALESALLEAKHNPKRVFAYADACRPQTALKGGGE